MWPLRHRSRLRRRADRVSGPPAGARPPALFKRGWLRLTLLLGAPAAWFVLIYLAALAILFV